MQNNYVFRIIFVVIVKNLYNECFQMLLEQHIFSNKFQPHREFILEICHIQWYKTNVDVRKYITPGYTNIHIFQFLLVFNKKLTILSSCIFSLFLHNILVGLFIVNT